MNSSQLLIKQMNTINNCAAYNSLVGPTGPIGLTGPVNIFLSGTGPTGSLSSTTINSSTGVFIQNISVTTYSSTETVLLHGRFQYFIDASTYQIAATIGRGSGTPSTAFINLSNNTAFSTSEIVIADAISEQDNLNTSLATQYTVDSNKGSSLSFSITDTPGSAGTFTYAIRIVSTASANTLFLRQIYLNAIKISN